MIDVKRVCIYSEPRCDAVDYEEIAEFVSLNLPGLHVEMREPLLEQLFKDSGGSVSEDLRANIAGSFAAAKVKEPGSPVPDGQAVLPGELDYEHRRLSEQQNTVFGLLYDAHLLSSLYRKVLGIEAARQDSVHVIFTNQLIGTWEMADGRYHARAVLCGSPSLVSLSGLVEAPAKTREYYLARRGAEALGFPSGTGEEIASSYAEDCLEHGDGRLTEVAKGYAMQPIVYHITGEPFCTDSQCRLYNAHWQKELLRAQLGGDSDFCDRHGKALLKLQRM